MDIKDRLNTFTTSLSNAKSTDKEGIDLVIDDCINSIVSALLSARTNNSHVYVIGNGGSAGIASHMIIDLLNMAKIKAHTLYDLSMMTCISNDYGYENVFKAPLEVMFDEGDILIAISSSGESRNILNAVESALSKKIVAITLSGFSEQNSLKSMGDMNIWIDSHDYGIVEIGHAFLLHNVADRLAIISKE